jgi:transcription termination/antitermination protein NusA
MSDEAADEIARLFDQAVPEVAGGAVALKAVARRRGYRSKVAVLSRDPKVNAIGAFVGVRGCRIMKVIDGLGGHERIDLIRWDDSPEVLIQMALQPAAVVKVTLHLARHRATVVVDDDQLPLAHGRHWLNRELASQLCAWQIDLVTRAPGD